MVNLKASRNSEAGVRSSKEDTERGIRFNEDMVKAGILKAADGLKPSRFGKRVSLGATRKPSVTDGPFAETKELVAGYWLWEVNRWTRRSSGHRLPAPSVGRGIPYRAPAILGGGRLGRRVHAGAAGESESHAPVSRAADLKKPPNAMLASSCP
jgi:hypothetical protein